MSEEEKVVEETVEESKTKEIEIEFRYSSFHAGCNIVMLACGSHRYMGAANLNANTDDGGYLVHDALLYVEVADQRTQTTQGVSITPKLLKPYQILELPFLNIYKADSITLLEANKAGHKRLADMYEAQVQALYAESFGIVAPTLEDIANVKAQKPAGR